MKFTSIFFTASAVYVRYFISKIVKGERRSKSSLLEFDFSEPHPILGPEPKSERRAKKVTFCSSARRDRGAVTHGD